MAVLKVLSKTLELTLTFIGRRWREANVVVVFASINSSAALFSAAFYGIDRGWKSRMDLNDDTNILEVIW